MEFYVFFISSNGTIDFKTILASSKEHAISYFNKITSNKYEIAGVFKKGNYGLKLVTGLL